jgi:hypothetical protein
VRDSYEKLVRSGCDVDKLKLNTALEARVFRNALYAVVGRTFRSTELTALFSQDGDWFPRKGGEIRVPKRDAICSQRLSKVEKRLKKTYKLPKKAVRIFTADPRVFLELRKNKNLKETGFRETSSTEWSWTFIFTDACGGDGSPEQKNECSAMWITCSAEGKDLNKLTTVEDLKTVRCRIDYAG